MIQASEIVAAKANGSSALAPPESRLPISIRMGTLDDLPFIDALQKQYSKQLGFFPRAQIEGYIKNGWALIAEEKAAADCADFADENMLQSAPSAKSAVRLGFVLSRDRYQKRDELGAIYQLCVDPNAQRKFVGAALLKAVFDRASYGCRLFCCWCAQDIAANKFWESMGFVPLAYRAGSEKKSRTHIFWQKRIRQDDVTTPWWFPSKTEGGSIREDRIVLPIPPGQHWSDAKPLILPADPTETKQLEQKARGRDARATKKEKKLASPMVQSRQFGPPGSMPLPAPEAQPQAKQPKPKREKRKVDPRLVQMSRELRDRWLEKVNEVPMIGSSKYDLTRAELPPYHPIAEELPRLAA